MPLIEEFERTGNWLFRWRSYLPLVLFGVFLVALTDYEYMGQTLDMMWELVCLLVSFFGLGIRILTVGHTPKNTSGRITKKQVADTLNTTGMYSVVRNPLYLGNFMIGLGIALFVHLWWVTLIYMLLFCLYYERIIFAEEAFLRRKFGQRYLFWANRTPAFIPDFRLFQGPDLPFSWKNVLRREYNGFFMLIVVMFFFEVCTDLVIKRAFDFDWRWAILVTFGFVVWVTLRSLKKHTRLLHVEGR